MKSAKVIVGLLVLISAGAISLYVFVSGKTNELPLTNEISNTVATGNDVAAAALKNYISEKLPEKVANVEQATDAQNLTADTAAVDPNNLTELFARELAKEVVMKNPEGPLSLGDGSQKLNFPGQIDYQSFLSQSGNNTDWKKIVASKPDIKITADNSKASAVGYLNSMLDILTSNSKDVSLSTDALDVPTIEEQANIAEEKLGIILAQVSVLTVPQVFVSVHQQILRTIEGKKIAFEKLKNSANDPLGGLVATGWLQDIQTEEDTIQPNLLAIIKANNFFK